MEIKPYLDGKEEICIYSGVENAHGIKFIRYIGKDDIVYYRCQRFN